MAGKSKRGSESKKSGMNGLVIFLVIFFVLALGGALIGGMAIGTKLDKPLFGVHQVADADKDETPDGAKAIVKGEDTDQDAAPDGEKEVTEGAANDDVPDADAELDDEEEAAEGTDPDEVDENGPKNLEEA